MDNNCYDFVIRFLNAISYMGHTAHSKVSIVENIIGMSFSPKNYIWLIVIGSYIDEFNVYYDSLVQLRQKQVVLKYA
jgi:hypothetical protein